MSKESSNSKKRKLVSIIVVSFIIFGLFCLRQPNSEEELTYDQFLKKVYNDEVVSIEAFYKTNKATISLENGEEKEVNVPSMEELTSIVTKKIDEGNDINFKVNIGSKLDSEVIIFLLMNLLFMGLIILNLYKRAGSGYKPETVESDIKFDDVAGIEEEKEQLIEIVEFLKDPDKYDSIGAKIPKGILLTGAPGVGKTLLAKAIGGEADVPFFHVNGSSFEEMFVGVGASRVRKLFNKAKKCSPSIIFIDEFDSLAKTRFEKYSNHEQTLNQLLSEMDGFESADDVIVIAATNHSQILDPAIIRPGRFDEKIYIPYPDVESRKKILRVCSKDICLAGDVSLDELAKKTVGCTGADLANILNEAAIYAVNNGKTCVNDEDISEAIARVFVGLEKKNAVIREEDKYRTAIHESGHAIASAILRPEIRNFGISIIPRGNAGGYNFFNDYDKMYNTAEDLKRNVQVLYSGRVAEELILDSISNGAANDLQHASEIIYNMVIQYGMGETRLVKINNESFNESLDASAMKNAEDLSAEYYKKTKDMLLAHIDIVKKLAENLQQKEYLTAEEVSNFIKQNL